MAALPGSILWRMTPWSFEFCCILMFVTTPSQIIRCDSKNSSTHFLFSASSFSHLSYAVSQALRVTSHPLPGGSAAPTACDLIQNHYCTPHLTEVYTQPPPRAPETRLGLLASKNLQLHNTDLCFSSFCRVTVLRCRLEAHSSHMTQNPLRVYKTCTFYTFTRFCSGLFQKLWTKTIKPLSAKCDKRQKGGKMCLWGVAG